MRENRKILDHFCSKSSLLALIVILYSTNTYSFGFRAKLGLNAGKGNFEDAGNSNKVDTYNYSADLQLGMKVLNIIYFGGIARYETYVQTTKTSEVGGNNYAGSKTQYGAFLGAYFFDTYLTYSHFINDSIEFEKSNSDGNNLTYSGSGFLVELSRSMGLFWGLSLFYSASEYDKSTVGSQAEQSLSPNSTSSSYGIGVFFAL